MNDKRIEIIDIIKREFIGPDPIEGMTQSNGEEILTIDPPRMRYSAGILFPKSKAFDIETPESDEIRRESPVDIEGDDEISEFIDNIDRISSSKSWKPDPEEDVINLSNSFRQSAISITAKLGCENDKVKAEISAGVYDRISTENSQNGKKEIKYYRRSLKSNVEIPCSKLPKLPGQVERFDIIYDGNPTNLILIVTNRNFDNDIQKGIYTFSLVNDKITSEKDAIKDEDCFFQVELKLFAEKGFLPMPEVKRVNSEDEDYLTNLLLYRNIKTYAIGHGCSAKWDYESNDIYTVCTTFLPYYEVKPIVPNSLNNIDLDMFMMSDFGDKSKTIENLMKLCNDYREWIDKTERYGLSLREFGETVNRHITNCRECHKRMEKGLDLLRGDDRVYKAFSYMNRAMLLQQLHYGLPLQKWEELDDEWVLTNSDNKVIQMPNISDRSTWYDYTSRIYGKWRPFQIAFILMNLNSMTFTNHPEREIVDLIWFPTGGGKTEAYLGLSAFTIFIRRLKSPDNAGTAILMRYTLRLLTTQQYERASSMICACELIRKEKEQELGNQRFSIGLWVGDNLTPNRMEDAVTAYNAMSRSSKTDNPFILLKCPWCGAQMGAVPYKDKNKKGPRIFGYKKKKDPRQRIVFQCSNIKCDFSADEMTLPLYVVDTDIYENPPTLIIGTVDKFAMLPFRPEARAIFGKQNHKKYTPPELIIQDELHLISGPLGSMVGHYETLIAELCKEETSDGILQPKIIASTATISRAKEQCNALYGTDKNKIFQFPSPGIDAGDSFFAIEDKSALGRLYVGVSAPAASSFSMSNIRMYSTLLFAAKELTVDDERERDPYWTNLGYFNSLRELGQTATWISADIEEYLHGMYLRRMREKDPNYKQKRRYIYKYEELTSRISNDEIPASLQKLSVSYMPPYEKDEYDKRPVDICLATNMISVGVDIPRLGLMTVIGQPKTTSEYIQATSRVGRGKYPGLVITMYNPAKARDKSHYEHFQIYHAKLYCHVEPTSVTPFSPPLRERALHAILVGLVRLNGDPLLSDNPKVVPTGEFLEKIYSIIRSRVEKIDHEELDNTIQQISELIKQWKNLKPAVYDSFNSGGNTPLIYAAGMLPDPAWENKSWPTPTSMRNVDALCGVRVLKEYLTGEESYSDD